VFSPFGTFSHGSVAIRQFHCAAEERELCTIAQTRSEIQSSLGRSLTKEGRSAMTPQPGDWRKLAERVSTETDSSTLTELAEELNRILEREQKRISKTGGAAA
jgi:hypothetical protein